MVGRLLPNGIRALAASLALCLLLASAAHAEFGIAPGSYSASVSSEQAGGHPDFNLAFAFNTHPDATFTIFPDADAKTLIVDLPPGLLGNPQATPKCRADYLRLFRSCPADSQIGVMHYTLPIAVDPPVDLGTPLYNMVQPADSVAELGFLNTYVVSPQIHIQASVRSAGDYGVRTMIPRLPGNLHPSRASVEIWGVPSDPSHDTQRGSVLDPSGGCLDIHGVSTGSCPAHLPPRPFLSNPTQCSTPISVSLSVDPYQDPGSFVGPEVSGPQQMSGCDRLPFDPSISLKPAGHRAGGPSGYSVDLHIPQSDSPIVPSTAHLKKTVVALPEGVTLNPSSADGLGACSEDQIGYLGSAFPEPNPIHFDESPSACPDSSKVASVEVQSPVLERPLTGSVFLASPNANPLGSLLAIYIEVHGSGVIAKLAGSVEADPTTGRLSATFDHNPQLPFEDLTLNFTDGNRAPLVNPRACGTYTSTVALTPWSYPDSPEVDTTSAFEISADGRGGPCPPRSFAPTLSAGTTNPLAGAFSPLTVQLRRSDSEGEFSSIPRILLPAGLSASLRGIPYCPESALASIPGAQGTAAAQLASPSCPDASQLGTVTVGAGAGPSPFYLSTGRVYLAGPYRGAPLSLAVLVPALAGPFDLGNVLVRAALRVDPETAQITAVSNPLPTILYGIPLQVRDIRVNVDRSHFTLNPTDCEPTSIRATVLSTEGQSANPNDRFQVGECARLPFRPKLRLSLKGKIHRRAHPSLGAVLTAKPGEANIARAQVKLPKAAFLDNAHIGAVCTRVQFTAHACPPASIYGYASAVTPLLDQPLQGPVYLRSSSHQLPDLIADLGGQIEVALAGRTDSVKGALRNTFETVPDAPVSRFTLRLFGGKRGLIEMSSGFCRHPRASVKFAGQSGKTYDTTPVVESTGCHEGSKKIGSS